MDPIKYRKSKLCWYVICGVVDIDNIPQIDLQERLLRVVDLIQESKMEEAIGILPDIYLEYNPNNNPDLTSNCFSNAAYRILIDLECGEHFLRLECQDDYLIIDLKVYFDIEVVDYLQDSEINEMLEFLGPWYSGRLSIPFMEVNEDNQEFFEDEFGIFTDEYAVGDLDCFLLEDGDSISDFT